jgi:hypothetical protein
MHFKTTFTIAALALSLGLAAGCRPAHAQAALKIADTAHPITFMLVSSSDHIAGLTGATPLVYVSKNGGTAAVPAGTVSEVDSVHSPGLYKLVPTSADTGTGGSLHLYASAAGADPADRDVQIVAYDPFDANLLGLTGVGTLANQTSAASAIAALPTASTIAAAVAGITVDTGVNLKQATALMQAALTGKYAVAALNTTAHTQVTTYYRADGTTAICTSTVTYGSNNLTVVGRTTIWSNLP